MVKVRMDGPRPGRWIEFARWWWERNRGIVPPGKRVCHADGDSLNDDPSNFILLTPGDVVFMAHDRDPAMSRRNYKKAGIATAAANVQRGYFRRLREWLPTMWYPVDLEKRLIHNRPVRKRWQVYQAFGMNLTAGANGKVGDAAAMGWPGLPILQARILASLAGRTWTTYDQLRVRLHHPQLNNIYAAISFLKSAGLVLTMRTAGRGTLHISRKALAVRCAPCPVIPIRGSDLADERFADFEKRTPGLETLSDQLARELQPTMED